MPKLKRPALPGVVSSMSEFGALVRNAVQEQAASAVPDVVMLYANCAPDFVFHVGGFPDAGFKNKDPTSDPLQASASKIDPKLDVMTANDVLGAPREADFWRNLTKFVTEDVVRNVQMADGFRYTYRNRDKFSLKHGVRLNYVCVDSLQNKNRITATGTRRTRVTNEDGTVSYKKLRTDKVGQGALAVCDCKGFVNVDFDDSKNEIRIVYRHLLIHHTPTPKSNPTAPEDAVPLVKYETGHTPAVLQPHPEPPNPELSNESPSKFQFVNGLNSGENAPPAAASPAVVRSRSSKKSQESPESPRVYVCNICNKALSRQEHLKRHVKSVHSDEKPFECPHCGKKFARQDNMSQHIALRSTICARRRERLPDAD